MHWLCFAIISDVHIVDEESPARMLRFDGLIHPAWRPHGDYAAHVVDATLGVLNARHKQGKGNTYPIDFLLATGDLVDTGQSNEFDWFVDTMDGAVVRTDSGDPDGELRPVAPEDNPKLAYQAEGIDPDIPWYAVFGNHDGLAMGNFTVRRDAPDPVDWCAPQLPIVAELTGLHAMDPPLNALCPTLGYSPAVLRASEERIDPETLQLLLDGLEAGPIAPDPDRHYSSRAIFIETLLNSTSHPPGHGYDEADLAAARAYYSLRPIASVPVRLAVLDMVASEPMEGIPAPYAVLPREQFETFLKPTIEAARRAGEYVLVVSHHPTDCLLPLTLDCSVTSGEFRRYLARQPNILAHLAGHHHRHHVTKIPGKYPYLEIETASIIDYPQEGRILDLFYDGASQTFRLESTLFSHTENPTRLSSEGYRRAAIDVTERKAATAPEFDIDLDRLFAEASAAKGLAGDALPYCGLEEPPSKSERYGRREDRTFTYSFRRPAAR